MQNIYTDFLPWDILNSQWIVISSPNLPGELIEQLGMKTLDKSIYAIKCCKDWQKIWKKIESSIAEFPLIKQAMAAIISQAKLPSIEVIENELRPIKYLSNIAQNSWLIDAIYEDTIVSFLQPVVDRRGKIFGYEAFARISNKDGGNITGAKIIEASRLLKIEYRIDRLLHAKAIKAMIQGDYSGTLFVNFLPGFIQKPDIYLDGLNKEVRKYGLITQRIALDLTHSETERSHYHLQNIQEYCQQQGYHISLDNIISANTANKMLKYLQPAFIKLDSKLVSNINKPNNKIAIENIIKAGQSNGATIIAQGVETENILQQLKDLKVDLFQGYHIGRPQEAPLTKTS